MMRTAGLTGDRSVRELRLALAESVKDLREGEVDALVWSGGVPTPALSALARDLPLRFLALDGFVSALREVYGRRTLSRRRAAAAVHHAHAHLPVVAMPAAHSSSGHSRPPAAHLRRVGGAQGRGVQLTRPGRRRLCPGFR